jgi:galactokinase
VSLQHKWVPLLLSQHEIVLINSAVHHSLASGEYNKRRAECKEGLNVLSAVPGYGNSFRNITPQMVKQQQALLPEIIYKRCLYVVEEMERVQLAADYLQQNNIAAFGSLLYETHHGLQHLYEVSCPEIDYLVQQAKQHKAVIGARLMGGGFGGTVICIIEKQAAQNIVQEIVNNYRQKFNIQAEAYFVQPASGTHWVPINAE